VEKKIKRLEVVAEKLEKKRRDLRDMELRRGR
jgi:hypothetical protein